MKNTISLLFTLISIISNSQSQHLKTFKLLPPESNQYTDLEFLNKELQGKQLVMLGEYTHMYGNIFEMKARIIEYLHKELGYTTIAMESSMYDLWLMNKKGFTSKGFNKAVWGVWSQTKEFQRLVNYIDSNNIKVIGFDSQVKNSSQFIDDFFDYCDDNNIDLKLEEDDMGIIIEGVLESVIFEEDDIKYEVYEKEIKRIIQLIEKLESNETNYYWAQFTKGLLSCSKDAFYNTKEFQTTDLGNKNHNFRDAQMADNLLSYMRRFPNEKIICWADNIHVINNISSVEKSVIKDFISMGNHIKKVLKNKAYSLATIHANDSLYNSSLKIWHKTPIHENSFEHELNSLNTPYLFVSSNQENMQPHKQSRILNFTDFTDIKLNELHDGYIFFQHATLPKIEAKRIEEIEKSKNAISLTSKNIALIPKGSSLILKGKIIDSETNEPIPYTNLIMKEEQIYRVADDNGVFQITIPKKYYDNSFVHISSMGYETKIIKLKNLTNNISLSPKFEELDEVVITGYLSPKTVLKKAIKLIDTNHPISLHNYKRYGNIIHSKNDQTRLDLELITKDCDHGYDSPFVITQRVEQIKWNKNLDENKYKTSSEFFSYRQNAIRYANILHKRKYKKFKLKFEKSKDIANEGLYIIAFETERNKWNYTNRPYPTRYSGKIYINKENFAFVKVIENWETKLTHEEIEKYFKKRSSYKNLKKLKFLIQKEENICFYANNLGDGKYYATKYFKRSYTEKLDDTNQTDFSILERNSQLYDYELKNVEDIDYEYNKLNQVLLNRVDYDKIFWTTFYKNHPKFIN